MCGRFVLANPGSLFPRFRISSRAETRIPLPRFNVAPTTLIPVVIGGDGEDRKLVPMRWGFAPPWMKPGGTLRPQINARVERIVQSRMFGAALRERRCIVPCDGFYEWDQATRQPWHIKLRDGGLMGLAGIWTPDAAGEPTCAIVTTAANALMAPFHHRMPCILSEDDEAAWLDSSLTDAASLLPLLRQCPPELMDAYPVSNRVNNVRNDDPQLVLPLAG